MERERLDISVLYAEDEAITRMAIGELLSRQVKTLYLAGNGREGLELYLRHSPDVVITDSKMPEMDGIEMTREIRDLGSDTPILFISACEESDFIEETSRIGITGYIIKPIDTTELLDELKRLAKQIGS